MKRVFSKEHRKKLSDKAKERIEEKNSFYGKKHNKTTKLKMSQVSKERFKSKKLRKQISEKLKGKYYGKKGKDHHSWKGEKAVPNSIHNWLKRKYGLAKDGKCELCGKKGKDWSNKDHKYSRNLKDWWILCRLCHKKYDSEQGCPSDR